MIASDPAEGTIHRSQALFTQSVVLEIRWRNPELEFRMQCSEDGKITLRTAETKPLDEVSTLEGRLHGDSMAIHPPLCFPDTEMILRETATARTVCLSVHPPDQEATLTEDVSAGSLHGMSCDLTAEGTLDRVQETVLLLGLDGRGRLG